MSQIISFNEEEITEYLKKHPTFFERHPALLADMYIPSHHGSGAVSLAERQQLAQRDKIRVLEAKFSELMHHGEQNDSIIQHMHVLAVSLLEATSLEDTLSRAESVLKSTFNVPFVSLQLWKPIESSGLPSVSELIRPWANELASPYTGPRPPALTFEAIGGQLPSVDDHSYAVVTIKREEQAIAMLLLASDDAARFYEGMGTLYLGRIGELIGAGLSRFF